MSKSGITQIPLYALITSVSVVGYTKPRGIILLYKLHAIGHKRDSTKILAEMSDYGIFLYI